MTEYEQKLLIILGQIVDNQKDMSVKLDKMTMLLSNLTNTIIKYDNDFQQQVVKSEK